MKRLQLLLVFVLCSLAAHADDRIFFVSRNLNRNIIVYDVQLKDGKLNRDHPLHVYWYNQEHNPVTTNELNFIQRKLAYGYTVVGQGENEATVKLKAYKKRLLTVRRHDGKWVGTTTINGAPCVLTEIYAHCPTRTSCDYMELRGYRLSDGRAEKEVVR